MFKKEPVFIFCTTPLCPAVPNACLFSLHVLLYADFMHCPKFVTQHNNFPFYSRQSSSSKPLELQNLLLPIALAGKLCMAAQCSPNLLHTPVVLADPPGGFVEEDDRWVADELLRDGQPLALSPREEAGPRVLAGVQAPARDGFINLQEATNGSSSWVPEDLSLV